MSNKTNPIAGEQPEHQRGVRGEGLLEVVVLGRSAADQAAGRQDQTHSVDGGPGGGRRRPGGRHDLVEGPPGVGRPRVPTAATPAVWARVASAARW